VLRVTWLYQDESLRGVFCDAMQRDAADLDWHIVVSLFRAIFVMGVPQRAELAPRLAGLTGYRGQP
jgi:hypothetical protein